MIIVTKDRGPLKAKRVIFLHPNSSHDMIVEWESGDTEHMRRFEIEEILE